MTREPRPLDPCVTPGEREVHAEHMAALEATLFRREAETGSIVLELWEGSLRRVAGDAPDA